MGCLDGAEVCGLTGLYMLSKIKSVFKNQNDVGLYRDDGLGILRNLSGPQIERVRKEIKISKEYVRIINNKKIKPQGCTVCRHRTRSYK